MTVSETQSRDRERSAALKEKAYELGAGRTGIAPVDRWNEPPPFDTTRVAVYPHSGYLPSELLPSAQSVIVFAVRQLDGVMDFTTTPSKTTGPQGNFGYVHLNRRLNDIAFGLASWLEDQGFRALPLGSAGWSRYHQRAITDERVLSSFYGIFSLKRAAVLTGVGRKARNGLVASPEFGVRMRIGGVITSAPLAGDPLPEGDPCPPKCTICMRICPTDAISTDGRVSHLRCFSDTGLRGRTYEQVLDTAKRQYPVDLPGVDTVSEEHGGNEGTGNRRCKVVCMALCPLGKRKLPDVLLRGGPSSEVVPKVQLPGFPEAHNFDA
jgi:epoxyqueuosine reductase QueG